MSSLLALSCLHPDEQILFLIIYIDESSEVLVIIFRKNLILDPVTAEVFLLFLLTILVVVTVVPWIYY